MQPMSLEEMCSVNSIFAILRLCLTFGRRNPLPKQIILD
ncbi:hypothetical protein BN77_p11611 [Rhizobium mesoamericanum STM3625]|uniref:Transposase n=1 Tax=Rhizobium mesoamericanum STM3625 TaxID=1211777 RepID=K0Q2R9_9HYPH|nr:hypothetical protein BN77_p11611 [Rhizobium mesoamericanum STM3625]